MTKKEIFLNRLEDQIKVLQGAYDYNKSLPDYIFENLQETGLASNAATNISTNQHIKDNEPGSSLEYGENKKLVLKILTDNNKAMKKADILEKFLDNVVMPDQMALNAVTNSLAALNKDNTIKGYKPAGIKFKGLFWTLEEWWITDLETKKVRLPLQYEPYSGKLKE